MVTGNGQGLAGFGIGKAKEMPAALRKARNRDGQKLMHFEIYNGHTSKKLYIYFLILVLHLLFFKLSTAFQLKLHLAKYFANPIIYISFYLLTMYFICFSLPRLLHGIREN